MSEKNLTIKLRVDTIEGDKLTKTFERTNAEVKKLDAAVRDLDKTTNLTTGLTRKKHEEIINSYDRITAATENYRKIEEKAISMIETKSRGYNLAMGNILSAAGRYEKALEKEISLQRQLIQNIKEIEKYAAYGRNLGISQNNTITRPPGFYQTGSMSSITGRPVGSKETALPDTSEIKKAAKNLEDYGKKAQEAERHTSSLASRVIEAVSIYKLYNFALGKARDILLSIPREGMAQQAAAAPILGIFGTKEGVKQLEFVAKLAEEAGQNILALEQGFKRFASSAKIAGASIEEIQNTFEDFTKTATVLKLTEDQVTSLYLAIEQMFAKGVVQSEEIKKQLGNVLPGAVEIAARAMEMSVADFMEAMKQNQIIAKDAIPKIAALYREIFAGTEDLTFLKVADQLQANLVRVSNRQVEISRRIFSIVNESLNSITKSTATFLGAIERNVGGIVQALSVVVPLLTIQLGSLVKHYILALPAMAAYNTYVQTIKATHGSLTAAILLTINAVKTFITTLATGIFTTLSGKILLTVGAVTALGVSFSDLELKYGKFTGLTAKALKEIETASKGSGEAAEKAKKDLEDYAKIAEESNSVFLEYKDTQIEVTTALSTTWDLVKKVAGYAFDGLVKIFSESLDKMLKKMETWRARILLSLQDLGTGFKAFGQALESNIDISKLLTTGPIGAFTNIQESVNKGLTAYDATMQDLSRTKEERVKKLVDSMYGTRKNIQEQVGSTLKDAFSTMLTDPIGETTKEGIKGIFNAWGEEARKKQKEIDAEKMNQIKLPPLPGTETITGSGQAGKSGKDKKIRQDIYAETERMFREHTIRMMEIEENLEIEREQYNISLKDYYAEQQKILEENIAVSEEYYNQKIALALQNKDSEKAQDFELDKKEMFIEASVKATRLIFEEIEARRELNDEIRNINVTYAEMLGNYAEVARLQNQDNEILRMSLKAEKSPESKEALGKLNAIDELKVAEGELQEIMKQRTDIMDEIDLKNDLIQTRIAAGVQTEWQGMQEIDRARENQINVLENYLTKVQELYEKTGNRSVKLRDEINETRRSLKILQEEGSLVARSIRNTLQGSLSNAFTDFITGAKSAGEAMQDFATSILDAAARILANEIAMQLIQGVLGGLMGAFGPSTSGATSGIQDGGLTSQLNNFLKLNAKGNTFKSSSLSKYSNSIVDKPTLFPFARGIGLMGEDGSEAILPLKRDKYGNLGVSGETSNQTNITINVSVDRSKDETDNKYALKIAETIARRIAKEEVIAAARPGNINNRLTEFS